MRTDYGLPINEVLLNMQETTGTGNTRDEANAFSITKILKLIQTEKR